MAGVTRRAIPLMFGGHRHRFKTNTDFYKNHHHRAIAVTGRDIKLRNGKHIHYIKSVTTCKKRHRHRYQGATLIQDPIG